jgi:tetratricopeptide (TPR) repeat protein
VRARRAASLLGLLLGAVLLPSCATALRQARPLAAIAGGVTATPAEVDGLLRRAAELKRQRSVQSMRQAAVVALQAAAADPARDDAILAAVRARVWLADHEASGADRVGAATGAVEIAQWCGRDLTPPPPACAYWLGAALGVQARERPSTGLSALPRIEAAFKEAAAADPTLEEGGPDRALALLYVRAPGWPSGPGDPDLGLQHARQAVALRPDYPPNQLALGEALEATGDAAGARSAYGLALDLARAAAARSDPDALEWVREAREALGGQNDG